MNYMILVVVSLLFFLASKFLIVNDKLLSLIYIFVVALLASSRSVNIPDTIGYINFYEKLSLNLFFDVRNTYMEPGFVAFSVLVKSVFGQNHQIYFFIISITNILLIFFGIVNFYEFLEYKKNNYRHLYALVIYVMTFGYSFNYITLRSGLAFSLIFLAFSYLLKSKIMTFVLILTSFMIHNSVIVLIITLPLIVILKKIDKKHMPILVLMLVPLLVVGYSNIIINSFFFVVDKIPYISERFRAYTSQSAVVDQKGALIRVVMLIGITYIFSIHYYKNKVLEHFFYLFLVGMILLVTFTNLSIIGRITELYLANLFILFSILRKYTRKNLFTNLSLYLLLLYFVVSNLRLIL